MKKMKARLVCLIVASVMLVGAVTVAAIEGSPYETLKNAFFNAMTMENFTLQGEMTIRFDGEVYERESIHYIHTAEGGLDMTVSGNEDERFTFNTDGLELRPILVTADGTQWYSARTSRANNFHHGGLIPAQELDTARFRFKELLIDILVGDLKNNMYMSSNDGIRRVSGTISQHQLPEIARLGIEMIIEENLRWHEARTPSRENFRSPMDIPIQSLVVNRISGDADIDAAGNLLYLNAVVDVTTVNIFGDSNNIEFSLNMNFYNIGTSIVQSPVSGAVELFTPEFMYEQFGRRYGVAYFTLNADGSINHGSITTAWPGESSGR